MAKGRINLAKKLARPTVRVFGGQGFVRGFAALVDFSKKLFGGLIAVFRSHDPRCGYPAPAPSEATFAAGAKCRVSRRCYHRADALRNRGLWKRWKAKDAFHFPTTPATATGLNLLTLRVPGAKAPSFGVAFIGTAEAVPFQNNI